MSKDAEEGPVIDTPDDGEATVDAGARLADAYGAARDAVSDSYAAARESVNAAYETARAQSVATLETARDKASQAREKTVQGIEDNPLAAIIGGLAIGAAVGALVPRSRREAELLAPVGEKINDAAKGAFVAAKAAGLAKLDELGLNGDVAKTAVQKLVSTATEAARSAGQAAAASVREGQG